MMLLDQRLCAMPLHAGADVELWRHQRGACRRRVRRHWKTMRIATYAAAKARGTFCLVQPITIK